MTGSVDSYPDPGIGIGNIGIPHGYDGAYSGGGNSLGDGKGGGTSNSVVEYSGFVNSAAACAASSLF